MAEWLVEEGVGEERALLVDNDRALAAQLRWPGGLEAGLVANARLVARPQGSHRGRAAFESGEEALVDKLPKGASEGSELRVMVTRGALRENGRTKLAQCRPSTAEPCPAPRLAESLGARNVSRFPAGLWEDVVEDARTGAVAFDGGSLSLAPSAAMTLIDVDGPYLSPEKLALAATGPVAQAVGRMGIGGNIGVDFPSLAEKSARKAVDAALGEALSLFDLERTAMNGFGFVQLVMRLERPSLLHRWHHHRPAASARLLLRRAEHVSEPGALLLTLHPALQSRLKPEWLEELARRTGREVRIATDPALALDAAFAQAVER